MPKAIDNTPHMVRLFKALPIKGYEMARSWEYAEEVITNSETCYVWLTSMSENYWGTGVVPLIQMAQDFLADGRDKHSLQSAIACLAMAHAAVNFPSN